MEVEWTKDGMWHTKGFKDICDKFEMKFFSKMLYGKPEITEKRQELNKDNRKWAYIIVGNTRKAAWVDNETMKAYKADGYSPTWMEYKHFKFDRWMSPSMMDM